MPSFDYQIFLFKKSQDPKNVFLLHFSKLLLNCVSVVI